MNVNVDFGVDFGVDFDFNADVGVDVDVGYDINFSVSFHLAVCVGVDACPVVVYIYKNLQTTMSFALSITSFSLYRSSHPSYSPRF